MIVVSRITGVPCRFKRLPPRLGRERAPLALLHILPHELPQHLGGGFVLGFRGMGESRFQCGVDPEVEAAFLGMLGGSGHGGFR